MCLICRRRSAIRPTGQGTDRPLVEIEQEYIMKVLGTHRNNISRAARTLGID